MKKLISVLLALCLALALCAFASAEASVFAGGSGTEDDPYQIATLEQFLAFAASVNDGSAQGYPGQTIVLTADIDASGADWQPAGHMDLEDMSNYTLYPADAMPIKVGLENLSNHPSLFPVYSQDAIFLFCIAIAWPPVQF